MDWLFIATPLVGALTGALGFAIGRARQSPAVPPPNSGADRDVRRLRLQLRESQHALESARHRTAWLSSLTADAIQRPGRPTARTFADVVAQLRGLASIESVFVSDGDGLARTHCDLSGQRMAALGTMLSNLDQEQAAVSHWRAVMFPAGASTWTLRRLPSWAQGCTLFAKAAGAATNRMALDVAVMAVDDSGDGAVPPHPGLWGHFTQHESGHTDPACENVLERTSACSLAIITDGTVGRLGTADGLSRAEIIRSSHALARILRRARHCDARTRSVCVELLGGGYLHLMDLDDTRQLFIASSTFELSDIEIQRIRGSLKRQIQLPAVEARAS